MTKPITYAKNEIANGRFPMMTIVAGEFNTFWLHDGDWKMLNCKSFNSREAAEKFRSKIIEKAQAAI